MKAKTKIIFGSAMTVAMCASLIAGSTFALFTSEAKTNIAITAGKVKVEATASVSKAWSAKAVEAGGYEKNSDPNDVTAVENGYRFYNGGTATYDEAANLLTVDGITPGDGLEVQIGIENYSTVNTKYRVEVGTVNDNGLSSGLEVTYTQDAAVLEMEGTNPRYSAWKELSAVKDAEAGEELGPITVSIELPVEKGDTYQNKHCDFAINVYAVQANGNVGEPEPVRLKIGNSTELKQFATNVNAGATYEGVIVELTDDIDANVVGYALSGPANLPSIGSEGAPFKGIFEGNGHTISNVKLDGGTALFGYTSGAVIRNLKVTRMETEGEKATLVGTAEGGLTLNGIELDDGAVLAETVKDGTVTAGDITVGTETYTEEKLGGLFTGHEFLYYIADGFVHRSGETARYEISNANGLAAFRDSVNQKTIYTGKTILLTEDIDLAGSESNQWVPIGAQGSYNGYGFQGTFDGCGHTVSGLYINQTVSGNGYGLFGHASRCVIQNLIIEGKINLSGEAQNVIVGGIVGECGESTTIQSCINRVDIDLSALQITEGCAIMVGGVAMGGREGKLVDCINEGNIVAPHADDLSSLNNYTVNIGGIMSMYMGAGGDRTSGIVERNLNKGTITYQDNAFRLVTQQFCAGGICGATLYGLIPSCYNLVGKNCGYGFNTNLGLQLWLVSEPTAFADREAIIQYFKGKGVTEESLKSFGINSWEEVLFETDSMKGNLDAQAAAMKESYVGFNFGAEDSAWVWDEVNSRPALKAFQN